MNCVLISALCLMLTGGAVVDEPLDADADLVEVEWHTVRFMANYTETFELSGEWIEFEAEDGTLRYAAVGDGPHSALVILNDEVEEHEVSPASELYWVYSEDGLLEELRLDLGTPEVELFAMGSFDPWNGAVVNAKIVKQSKCLNRVGATNSYYCKKSSKACTIKFRPANGSQFTINGKCDQKHMIDMTNPGGTGDFTYYVED